MFVHVADQRSGETLFCRRMAPRERLDARKFAHEIAGMYDCTIAEPDGHIPNCCGDIRVEFRPRRDDPVCIWSGESFYFAA